MVMEGGGESVSVAGTNRLLPWAPAADAIIHRDGSIPLIVPVEPEALIEKQAKSCIALPTSLYFTQLTPSTTNTSKKSQDTPTEP